MSFDQLAAIDLGSNSFHLQVGRVLDRQIFMLDGMRDPIQLGAGLDANRCLDKLTQWRALETLGRFGERLQGFPRRSVRAVGTNSLRVARNAAPFLEDAEARLGFPIEVIFGREEARLCYLGVTRGLPPTTEPRLVIDIGGGSTECIVGAGDTPELVESISMGCISWTLRFFPGGLLDKVAFKRAELAARAELQSIAAAFRHSGWKQALASSGTAKALAALGSSDSNESAITPESLRELRSRLIKAGDIQGLRLRGLEPDRARVLAGGLAIMSAVLSELEIDRIDVAQGTLRQGVLYDLLGRVQHADMREATVSQFMRRYCVDAAQGARVAALSERIYRSLVARPAEDELLLLRWAAVLQEIGISVAHAGYHKHSSYILSRADMPGFSRDEQARLACLVLAHRGKLAKFRGSPPRGVDWCFICALRLAALFHLAHTEVDIPGLSCRIISTGFQLAIDSEWLDAHPLTLASLENEASEWRSVGLKLELRPVSRDLLAIAA